MAGKHSKAGSSEADQKAPESATAGSSQLENSEAAATLKAEEIEAPAASAEDGTEQTEAAEQGDPSGQPSAETAHDDAASRASSGSDDKVVTSSPSKKSSSKSKKSGRNSRGKSNGSKRSSDELDSTKTENADPSGSTDASTDAEAQQGGGDEAVADADANAAHEQASTSSAHENGEESTSTVTNGRDTAHSKGAAASKELAQLGLGSFGDGAEDALGPRRSRRGPGASPDPKARIPKTEPETDASSLQAISTEQAETSETNDATVASQDAEASANAIDATDDQKAAETPAVPEEAMQLEEGDAEAKVEADNENSLERHPEATQEAGEFDSHDVQPEEGEVDYGNADEADLDGEEGGDEGVTRCVCGSADENVGLMIQCETCKCWQHCVCMGMQVEEDCPDVYFCEQCRPELHIPLLRSLGLLPKAAKKSNGKGGAKYSARELKDAKDAIALLAQENARRTQAAEAAAAAAAYNSRDRKGGANSRNEASKEQAKSPKRRSTMNSRDSAYGGWEPIPPGLLADGEVWDGVDDRKGGKKRKRGLPDDPNESSAETPEAGAGGIDSASASADSKRRRMSGGGADHDGDADMEEDEGAAAEASISAVRDKSKKKKGNNQYTVREASVTAEAASSKPRHPNQYTYRNKDRNAGASANGQKTGSSSTSNLTSHSPSPSPSKGRAENSRRAAARENASQFGTPAPGESSGAASRGAGSTVQWGLPDHLTHLAYLLPGSGHRDGSGKPSGSASGEESGNGGGAGEKKGSSSGSGSSAPSPPASGSVPTPFHVLSSIESSTKVRFPSRRMTLGEMRKRVRNIGEYVTRSQIEAVEREKRMKLLGIVPPYVEEMEDEAAMQDEAAQNDVKDAADTRADSGAEQVADGEANKETSAATPGRQQPLPLSMRLMEELTRELIQFQRRFGVGPGSYGSIGNSQQSASVV